MKQLLRLSLEDNPLPEHILTLIRTEGALALLNANPTEKHGATPIIVSPEPSQHLDAPRKSSEERRTRHVVYSQISFPVIILSRLLFRFTRAA
jgi:hypothetical protein